MLSTFSGISAASVAWKPLGFQFKAYCEQPTKTKASAARWIRHSWDVQTDSLRTEWEPGFFPRRAADWHREGSLDEIEQKENAGQREMF